MKLSGGKPQNWRPKTCRWSWTPVDGTGPEQVTDDDAQYRLKLLFGRVAASALGLLSPKSKVPGHEQSPRRKTEEFCRQARRPWMAEYFAKVGRLPTKEKCCFSSMSWRSRSISLQRIVAPSIHNFFTRLAASTLARWLVAPTTRQPCLRGQPGPRDRPATGPPPSRLAYLD